MLVGGGGCPWQGRKRRSAGALNLSPQNCQHGVGTESWQRDCQIWEEEETNKTEPGENGLSDYGQAVTKKYQSDTYTYV